MEEEEEEEEECSFGDGSRLSDTLRYVSLFASLFSSGFGRVNCRSGNALRRGVRQRRSPLYVNTSPGRATNTYVSCWLHNHQSHQLHLITFIQNRPFLLLPLLLPLLLHLDFGIVIQLTSNLIYRLIVVVILFFFEFFVLDFSISF